MLCLSRRLLLLILILHSQASLSNQKALVYFAGAIAVGEALLYGISAYQKDAPRELEKAGRWNWDLVYGFMRATLKIVPQSVKASLGKKDLDELYGNITKVQFAHTEGELIPGISEKLIDEGILESGDLLAHALHEPPNWAVNFFSSLGIKLEDYAAYTHWAVYQAVQRKGRIIDFDTRTEPRAPSLEKYLLERAEQGKKFIWILKPLERDLNGMNARISNTLKNNGRDYREAHVSNDFRLSSWQGDNCESLSYEIATGTAYSEQSAAWRAFTYLFVTTAASMASAIAYRYFSTRTQRN